jgi:hypothetical protein
MPVGRYSRLVKRSIPDPVVQKMHRSIKLARLVTIDCSNGSTFTSGDMPI